MMKCAEVHPNLGAFVLGGLEPEEEAEVQRHLVFCPACRAKLRQFEGVRQALEAAPLLADPPAYLKDRILSYVRAEESSSSNEESFPSGGSRFKNLRFVLPGVAAAAMVTIVALGAFVGVYTGSAVATIQLTPIENEDYWGVAELHPESLGNQRVELKLNNLNDPGSGAFYEAWFTSGGKYISAGSFTTTDQEQTDVWLTAPPQTRKYPTLLITEQSATGDPTPSEDVVLIGKLR